MVLKSWKLRDEEEEEEVSSQRAPPRPWLAMVQREVRRWIGIALRNPNRRMMSLVARKIRLT